MEIIKSSYHPVNPLEGKDNYKKYYLVDAQGKIKERILLDISDQRLRENIILSHFMQFYDRTFRQNILKIEIIGRDDPWDFKIKINGELIINIEITSISSSSHSFQKLKNEETYNEIKRHEFIKIRDLKKLNKLSPDFNFDETFNKEIDSGNKKDDYIKNPIFNMDNIWFSLCDNMGNMTDALTKAIKAKENKKHPDKDRTILIIDNKSIHFEIDNFREFLSVYQDESSFKEIWFYTGYYSDMTGVYREFDLSPIKINKNQIKLLNKTIKNAGNQVNKIAYLKSKNNKVSLLQKIINYARGIKK
jgi:hypothetical protein